jgi:hypothetical protein
MEFHGASWIELPGLTNTLRRKREELYSKSSRQTMPALRVNLGPMDASADSRKLVVDKWACQEWFAAHFELSFLSPQGAGHAKCFGAGTDRVGGVGSVGG